MLYSARRLSENLSVIGLAFVVILLQRLFEDRVIGLCCQNKMFKKKENQEKKDQQLTPIRIKILFGGVSIVFLRHWKMQILL